MTTDGEFEKRQPGPATGPAVPSEFGMQGPNLSDIPGDVELWRSAIPVESSLTQVGANEELPSGSSHNGDQGGHNGDQGGHNGDQGGHDGDQGGHGGLEARLARYATAGSHPFHLVASTLLSLLMVLGLLLIARWIVPPLVENTRYGWYRGQLRAEYDVSGEQLKSVSLDSLAEVSQCVSRRVGPSVVHINLLRDEKTLSELERTLFRTEQNLRYEGQGSGFVIDKVGHILTNNHVVEGIGELEVTLSDGRQLSASVIGTDPLTDLAVIKVEADGLLPIDWGDSDAVIVGTPVWAAGSPFGLQQTVTFGIVSGKHRIDLRGTRYAQTVYGGNAYGDLMQSDVALNPGNSGGPLVNSKGEVVGVNAAILGETYRGVSFSIPSKVALRVASNLIIQGEMPRGWLGVELLDLPLNERFDSDGRAVGGVRVNDFPAGNSPARDAGLARGDIIVEFDDQPVMSQVDLMQKIGEISVGSKPSVVVLRDGERRSFEVVISKRRQDMR